MTGQPLRQDGDLASICFGDGVASPAQRRLAVAALSRAAAQEAVPPEDSLPPDLLRAALAATARQPAGPSERAAAGTVRASRFATWASLAAGIAGFCLASWLIVQPAIDRGAPAGNLSMADEAADVRLVTLTPELRRELRRFVDDPAGAREELTALLPGLADRAHDIALSDGLLAVVRSDGVASVIRAERSGPALRLRLPEEAQ